MELLHYLQAEIVITSHIYLYLSGLCGTAGCKHKCYTDIVNVVAHCACNEGYELMDDQKTCQCKHRFFISYTKFSALQLEKVCSQSLLCTRVYPPPEKQYK